MFNYNITYVYLLILEIPLLLIRVSHRTNPVESMFRNSFWSLVEVRGHTQAVSVTLWTTPQNGDVQTACLILISKPFFVLVCWCVCAHVQMCVQVCFIVSKAKLLSKFPSSFFGAAISWIKARKLCVGQFWWESERIVGRRVEAGWWMVVLRRHFGPPMSALTRR